jgi:two-component system cell cycle sensor histidine kinase/response regulator CckA
VFVALLLLGCYSLRKQRRAQARQREAEQRITLLAQALQSASDCVVITDMSERVLYVNEAFRRTYEFDDADLIGRSIDIIRTEDNPPGTFDAIRQATFHGDGWRGILRNRAKHGRVFPVSLATSTVKDEQGRVIAAVGVARDRTQEESAEAAVRASEEKYRQVVERARDVIFTVDRDGYCTSMNSAGHILTGFVGDTPRGLHLSHLVTADQAPIAAEQLRRVLAGEVVPRFEIAVLSRVGKRLIFELDVHPICDGSVIVGAQGIARDVTARKELEAQLLQAQKMEAVGRLAGGVAHDFNNVLTVIMACAELAAMEVDPGSGALRDLEQIQHAAASAAALTRQLLIFSRKSVVMPAILDVNDSVRRLERMLRRLVGEDVDFVLKLSSNAGCVEADQTQLEQVVLNLFVNARDAMPSGGTLTIETGTAVVDDRFRDAHRLPRGCELTMLTVTDTGVGMTPDVKAQIFDPFFTTKDATKGTGLGLATVDAIVRQARGCVVVESAPGAGTTFAIYLPKVPSSRAAAGAGGASAARRRDTGTILFVEDDDAVRTVGARALRERGYTVLTARHAEAALEIFEAHGRHIDLLLTDVVMPGGSGRALAAEMRKDDARLRVIFTSGYIEDQAALRDIQADAHGFLQKPYSLEVLIREVGQILARSSSSDDTNDQPGEGVA